MPASFHAEALKSQAVAARTYTLKRLERIARTGSPYPENADITNLPQEGQAWLSEDERKQSGRTTLRNTRRRSEMRCTAPKERSWFTMAP